MTSRPRSDTGRSLLAREAGTIRKPHGGRLRVALAFPNSYHVGMSNLGFQTVYGLFNQHDEVVCERAFLPPGTAPHDRSRAAPRLGTLESGTPVADVDMLAFSVSFEWDYPNVVAMLRLAGLPVRAADRDGRHPLVVLGGPVSFLNPEPLAPFVDVVAVGEGELLVPALVRLARAGGHRATLLGEAARQPGLYVPALVEVVHAADGTIAGFRPEAGAGEVPIRKVSVRADEMGDPPSTVVFTPDTEFGSRLLVEVVRGCANLCRFCWAGYHYLPVRPFDTDRILRRAQEARRYASRAGLVAIALCDHPEIDRILTALIEMGYSISPASLRLDDLTESTVRLLRAGGERSLTIAPEAGSDRLRRVINKGMSNAEILERADLVFAAGVENLKLYFMLGLPTEDDEDLVAIRDLTLAIRARMLQRARARGTIGRISASVNPLVPKPGTAYQRLPMEHPRLTERKMRRLRELVRGIDNVQFTLKSERHSCFQALLSVGDRRVARMLEAVDRNGGHWRAAAVETDLDPDWYVFRDRERDALLPWNVVAGGPDDSFLRAESARAGCDPGVPPGPVPCDAPVVAAEPDRTPPRPGRE